MKRIGFTCGPVADFITNDVASRAAITNSYFIFSPYAFGLDGDFVVRAVLILFELSLNCNMI